jgi:dienelactone hydrolase
MRVDDIEYRLSGTRMVGYFAVDNERPGPRPGVLVCHEGPGLGEHARFRARRLALLGYAAFALDYQGGGKTHEWDDMMVRLGPMMDEPDKIREPASAGLAILLAQKEVAPAKVAAVGYCFGGAMALELARSGAELAAVVAFHAALTSHRPARAGNFRPAVLVCTGSEDPLVPADQRDAFGREMRAAGADWCMNIYGGAKHGFTDRKSRGQASHQPAWPGRAAMAYNGTADERSWRALLNFLDEHLGRALDPDPAP